MHVDWAVTPFAINSGSRIGNGHACVPFNSLASAALYNRMMIQPYGMYWTDHASRASISTQLTAQPIIVKVPIQSSRGVSLEGITPLFCVLSPPGSNMRLSDGAEQP